MLMVSWTRSTAAAAAALSTVFLSAFFKWQMLFARPPIRIFFLLLFYILFIFCLFFGVCVCFFISGTAIHRTRDTKSECPLYFSQKLCDGQQPRTFFSFFFFFYLWRVCFCTLMPGVSPCILFVFFVIHQRFKVKRIDRTRRRQGEWHRCIESDITSTE